MAGCSAGSTPRHYGGPRGSSPSGVPIEAPVICLQNHDQVGNRAHGERLHHQIGVAAWLAATTLLLMAPETPLLFMGQEWAASTPFLFFTDHEETLGALVVEGRRREFGRFAAFRDPVARQHIPSPQAEETWRRSILHWDERAVLPHAQVLAETRALLAVRHAHLSARPRDRTHVRCHAVGPHGLWLEQPSARGGHIATFIDFSGAAAREVATDLATRGAALTILHASSPAPGAAPVTRVSAAAWRDRHRGGGRAVRPRAPHSGSLVMTMAAPAWTPTSTYRLQLGPDLTFAQAEAIAPYLASLGVGALYLSPMLKARPGSTHGYDICDHGALNPDLGSEQDLVRLAATARARGMRLMADIVPNHMGVDPVANRWWREVLENGPCSPYAEYFDIDWEPVTPHLRQKVLLPILGDQYGTVLDRGQLQLEYEEGRLWLRYYEHRLPINPRQTPLVLHHAVPLLEEALGESHPGLIEFLSILEGLRNLPPYTDTHPDRIAIRMREKEVLRGRLLRLVVETPIVVDAIAVAVRHVNGTSGEPDSFDELHALLEAQPYRLASWRTAVDEINYRRFFDVNDLAGVCVEHEAVFEATHALVARWLREGIVHALRLDHPDGLFDPPAYFERLQQLARDGDRHDAPLYVVAEKILSGGERLRPDWQVHGTTGYEFLSEVNGLFLDPAGLRQLQRLYMRVTQQTGAAGRARLRGEAAHHEHGDVERARRAERRAGAHRARRPAHARLHPQQPARTDHRVRRLHPRVPDVREPSRLDRRGRAHHRSHDCRGPAAQSRHGGIALPLPARGAAARILTARSPRAIPAMRDRRLSFAMKLQQYTGPVQAKGVEDTTFYRHNVLVSINEVGGEPARAVQSVDDVHASNARRMQHWPAEMTTLSTHDTKLGEDVRARINVLSEIVDDLARHARARAASDGGGARAGGRVRRRRIATTSTGSCRC